MKITRVNRNKLVWESPYSGRVSVLEGGAEMLDQEEARLRAQQSELVSNQQQIIRNQPPELVNNQPQLPVFYGQLPQFGQRNLLNLPQFDERDVLNLPSCGPEACPASVETPEPTELLDYAGTAPVANYAPSAGALVTNEDTLDAPSMTFDPPQVAANGVLGAGATRNARRQGQRSQTTPAVAAGDTMDSPSWSF